MPTDARKPRKPARLLVVSQLVEEVADPDRVSLIYNRVYCPSGQAADERAEQRRRLSLSGDALILFIVANLIPYKTHEVLLVALKSAAKHLPAGWRLLAIRRDDGVGARLQVLVEEFQLQDNILFVGSRCDIKAYLAAADVGSLCSHEEGFSNAILEYMAAGLPVIATDIGGNAEAVVNEQSGLIVPAGEPAALGHVSVELSGAPAKRCILGLAGRRRAKQDFSMDSCVASYNSLYRNLLTCKKFSSLADDQSAATIDTKDPAAFSDTDQLGA
jgi:glycosyltransferase involved in cell wall biosynthesis